MTLTLNSPITEEQWDMIEDVDFDHTDSITFYTKHGKEVEFVKRKKGKWLPDCEYDGEDEWCFYTCSCCEYQSDDQFNYCPNCGAEMRGEEHE